MAIPIPLHAVPRRPCGRCCEDLDVAPMDLLNPARFNPVGLEFIKEHGLLKLSLLERANLLVEGIPSSTHKDQVRIQHRCQHLDDQKRCQIYDRRPTICRDFQCASRTGADACLSLQSEDDE